MLIFPVCFVFSCFGSRPTGPYMLPLEILDTRLVVVFGQIIKLDFLGTSFCPMADPNADTEVVEVPESADLAPPVVPAAQEDCLETQEFATQNGLTPGTMDPSPEKKESHAPESTPEAPLEATQVETPENATLTMRQDVGVMVSSNPGEGLLAEASDEEMQVQCKKCGRQVHVIDTTHRTEKIRWCLACNALVTLMRRHMSWPPEEFAKLDEQAQQSFFITAIEEKSGVFRYDRVRDLLIKQMTKVHISESKKETGGTYKPLSVFQKKGYVLPASFEHEAPKLWSEPLKCWTYLLPELTVKESEVTRTMEEAILRAEKSMRKRKALPDEGGDKRSLAIANDMVVDLLSESDAEQPTLPGGVFTCISIFPKSNIVF